MLQLLQVPLDGCELYTGIGLTNTYQLFTPENLILDDDLYHRARHAFLDIPMDEESLALDVIDAVGPGGHFLAQPHTRRHMRDAVLRAVSQEIGPDGQHYRDPVEVARERALDILEQLPAGAAGRRRARRAARPRRRGGRGGQGVAAPLARSGTSRHGRGGAFTERPALCFCAARTGGGATGARSVGRCAGDAQRRPGD